MDIYLHEHEVTHTIQLKEKLLSPLPSLDYLYFEKLQTKENYKEENSDHQ